ncbi:MAG TPA: hypothetical protein VGG75_39400 [Trebonia sp.]|jgi:hypothetical protein
MGSENRQELERLESTLAGSDPALAGKYGIFNRLAEDEPFARAEPVPVRAAAASPDGIPRPRPEVHDPGAPVPSPGKQPNSRYTMELRTSDRDHRVAFLWAWLFPLLLLVSVMLPMLIAVLVVSGGH